MVSTSNSENQIRNTSKYESDSKKAKEKEKNLSSCKIRLMRNSNNQTSVFEVSTALIVVTSSKFILPNLL